MLLRKWKGGDTSAFDTLVPLVYPHLRLVARAYLHRERDPDVLHATVLVHELYLRLLKQKKADWQDRQHFYTFCARMMRMILIDNARESKAKMRGSYSQPLSDDLSWIGIDGPELLDLSRALDELDSINNEMVKLVELRYFLGCTTEETAALLKLSKATVNRQLRFIKSWIYVRICPGAAADHASV
ncbi:MAG: ECF-type sigma factor [Terracidiphilus sp.]